MLSLPLSTALLAALGLLVLLALGAAIGLRLLARRREEAARRSLAESEQRNAAALAATEARYLSLFENASLPLFEEDFSAARERIDRARREGEEPELFLRAEGPGVRECAGLVKIVAVNRETRSYFGIDGSSGQLGIELPRFFGQGSWEPFSRELLALWKGETRFEAQFPILSPGPEPRNVIVRVSVAPGSETSLDRVLVSLLDITPLKETEETLRRTLAENRALLRELYHRTRNNLQVVCSMLHMESARISDERALTALRETEDRIQAMALIHDRLSATGDLSRIEMRDYLSDLAELLVRSHGTDPRRVRIRIEAEDVRLAIDQAVPCGMVLNELVSNALKHAFPDGRSGSILIGLRLRGGGSVELAVEDDGVGLPPDYDFRASGSVGLQNIFLIGEGQLRGNIAVTPGSRGGLGWLLRFPLLR